MLPSCQQEEAAWDKLDEKAVAGQLQVLERRRARIEIEQDLKAQERTVGSLKAAIAQSENKLAQITCRYETVRLTKDLLQPYMQLAKCSTPHHHTLMSTSKVRRGHLACHAAALRVLSSIIGWLLYLCLTVAYAGNSEIGVPSRACIPQRNKAIEITLPGTKIRAGTYLFGYADPDESEPTSKMGVFLPNGQFVYIEGSAPDIDAFDVGGDTNFGIYGKYFIADSFAFGSSYSRRMFLFTYTEQSVQLLDVISDAYGLNNMYSLKFIAAPSQDDASFESRRKDYRTRGFSWMDIAQRDNDTHPEIKLLITSGTTFDSFEFELFVEVAGDRLRIDLNPHLYESFF